MRTLLSWRTTVGGELPLGAEVTLRKITGAVTLVVAVTATTLALGDAGPVGAGDDDAPVTSGDWVQGPAESARDHDECDGGSHSDFSSS